MHMLHSYIYCPLVAWCSNREDLSKAIDKISNGQTRPKNILINSGINDIRNSIDIDVLAGKQRDT